VLGWHVELTTSSAAGYHCRATSGLGAFTVQLILWAWVLQSVEGIVTLNMGVMKANLNFELHQDKQSNARLTGENRPER